MKSGQSQPGSGLMSGEGRGGGAYVHVVLQSVLMFCLQVDGLITGRGGLLRGRA